MDTMEKQLAAADPDEEQRLERIRRMPSLDQCYNLMDFESVARRVMKKTAWGYYSSGCEDEMVPLTHPLLSLSMDADSCCRR